ncbi:protein translocase subunit SecD [Luteolibacter arcticus]|uniref:Multifunctional fusion protein n=1 Tax=Luteolibacter arcticus TaxID=1581411 RepID=A0ABT3GCK4_9BACT|nr:protein translocase subunit SecD [Luteolibacter arcticus]MCW1921362.1 protein translocase subunit SecD [Luteolibacter arcticus]
MLSSALLAVSILKDPILLFLSGLALLVLFFWYFATDYEARKRNIGTFLIFGISALCVLALYPPKETLNLGIDLAGGSSFTLQVKPKIDASNNQPIPITKDDVEQAKITIQKRLDAYGTKEATPVTQGTDKILVQMPGMSPESAAEIRKLLEQVARLEVRKVNPEGSQPGPNGKSLAERIKDNEEPRMPGYKVYENHSEHEGVKHTEYLLLSNRVAWTGKDVQQAYPEAMGGGVSVGITLTNAGGDKMIALTKDLEPGKDRIAVVLDGEVITAPGLREVPLGKRFQIDGQESLEEARALSNALKNPLENPLEIIDERTVSPTLGAAVVQQGVWAGAIGLSITALFVLIYYRAAGLVALFGLAVNTLIIFGCMAMFGFTFTLPGIAGMILSIGMAVDANVLIYERLREEIAAGKSLKTAIVTAYEKAFTAIFDSNLTSFITAAILLWMGSGTIKGFAITLVIGIAASMFSAILVTRVLFRWSNDLNIFKKLSFLNLIKSTNIDFLSKTKISYIVSGALILAAIGAVTMRGEKSFGIDFMGGTLTEFQLGEKHLDQQEVEAALGQLQTEKRPVVQVEKSITGELLTVRSAKGDEGKIEEHLRSTIPLLGEKDAEGKNVVQMSTTAVSAALGKDYLMESGLALLLGLLGILIYITIRFEFSFALGGFVALLHDVVLSAGLVILFGGELSLIHVGALLTIAGYSINDTIVIFDRIRESLRQGDGDVKQLMNEAINATLSRTVLTSLTTIATVAILSVFGGSALKDFSFMILIGLLIGTYSSIFIASPVVLWWSQRKGGSLRKEIMHTSLAESDIQPVP